MKNELIKNIKTPLYKRTMEQVYAIMLTLNSASVEISFGRKKYTYKCLNGNVSKI
jgi:hypothetical protein